MVCFFFFFPQSIKGLYKIPSSILGLHLHIYRDKIFNLLQQFAFFIYFYINLCILFSCICHRKYGTLCNSKFQGLRLQNQLKTIENLQTLLWKYGIFLPWNCFGKGEFTTGFIQAKAREYFKIFRGF